MLNAMKIRTDDAPLARRWRLGLVGCGWVGAVHADAARMLPGVEVVACSASRIERALHFAHQRGIQHYFADYRQLLALPEVDAVVIGTPNHLHHRMAVAALDAGKHVIVEKPLAVTLEEAEDLVARSKAAGRHVAYAEELCFVPKFVEAKRIMASGKLGEVRVVKQVEKHEGPHARWFYEADEAGGGIALDMGCHSVEFARWILGKPRVVSVFAHMATWLHREGLHRDVTDLEDDCVIHLAFEGGATALLESSWTLKGGMDSRTELHGTGGVLYANLLQEGMGMRLHSAPEGWTYPDVAWNFQNGYPHELAHFLRCFETGERPEESAEDGLAVLEILLAAYQSAGSGRRVSLPFRPRGVRRPVDLWRSPLPEAPPA
ncbi:MAG TPA: Gfo/Idh/MocA family oxidoreductase [Planctomycetota bacterium]|nr:Gfo/Idh/MocA family oxidoreductase [Planctomycetota bacterium]